MLVPPLVAFDRISRQELNRCLIDWDHRMGPWNRPNNREWFHGLSHNGSLVAVTAAGDLIRDRAAGMSRDQAMELGRVCAVRPDLCRAVLRLWREFVFPALAAAHGYGWALSYQDAVHHSGNLYRFDGWVRLARSRSGTDQRSGRKGRDKWIWGWHPEADARSMIREVA